MKRIALFFLLCAPILAIAQPLPVIDVHLHANPVDAEGPPPMAFCPGQPFPPHYDPADGPWGAQVVGYLKNPKCDNPIWSPSTNEELVAETARVLEENNVYGVTSGPFLDQYEEAAPGRIIRGLHRTMGMQFLDIDDLRARMEDGRVKVFSEVAIQYAGIEASDERFEPYLALAEELDIPLGIHIGTGPPGVAHLFARNYRGRMHSALQLEEAIMRHPRLRIYVMHAGWPMLDDMLALMWAHPHVYAGVGIIVYGLPRAEFHRYLRRMVEAGFGKRIMFGSDQMSWPGAIAYGIESIQTADFLTEEQKRDILYNNAARFLRLSEEEIARHHGQ